MKETKTSFYYRASVGFTSGWMHGKNALHPYLVLRKFMTDDVGSVCVGQDSYGPPTTEEVTNLYRVDMATNIAELPVGTRRPTTWNVVSSNDEDVKVHVPSDCTRWFWEKALKNVGDKEVVWK